MAAKCTVKFKHDRVGPTAILLWAGRSLNAINFPRGHRVTVSEARRAKSKLMAGCAELVRDAKRRARRRR